MTRFLVLALACLALSPAFVSAQLFTDCQCKDLRAMRERYCSARAARNEYERIQRYFDAEKAKTGETRYLSGDDKEMINQKCAQEAVNTATDLDVVDKATGETREKQALQLLNKDCEVVVNSKNACLGQIVQAHEAYHSQECLARNKLWSEVPAEAKAVWQSIKSVAVGDTKYLMTSREFAAEEGTAYGLEMHLIFAKWEELKKFCPNSAFEVEIVDSDSLGADFWNKLTPDSSGRRMYKMRDLSNDPCPNRPRPSPSACTLK